MVIRSDCIRHEFPFRATYLRQVLPHVPCQSLLQSEFFATPGIMFLAPNRQRSIPNAESISRLRTEVNGFGAGFGIRCVGRSPLGATPSCGLMWAKRGERSQPATCDISLMTESSFSCKVACLDNRTPNQRYTCDTAE